MKKHKWTYFEEASKTSKNGEKLWYLDIGIDFGYEMEIQKEDDGPFITFCYKGSNQSMPKIIKKKKFKDLADAKVFGVLWLMQGLKAKAKDLNDMIEGLTEEVLTEELKAATAQEIALAKKK